MDSMVEKNIIWAERSNAMELTNITLNHYAIHKQIILRKLVLAHKATKQQQQKQRFSGARGLWMKLKTITSNAELSQEDNGSDLWNEIIRLITNKVVYEDQLFQIEALLKKMPKHTYRTFQHLSKKIKP